MRTTKALGTAAGLLFGLSLTGCHQGVTEVLCEHEAHRVCDFYFDCCMPQERADLLEGPLEGVLEHFKGELTRYRCLDAVLIDCMNESFELRAAAEEGTVEIDQEALDACNAPFEEVAETCDYPEFRSLTHGAEKTCGEDAVLVGSIADGQPCYHSFECAGAGSECEHADGDTLTGVCVAGQAPLPAGAACDDSSACEDGLFCDERGDDGVCASKLAEGESCDDDAQCASDACDDDHDVCVAEAHDAVPYCQGT